MPVTWETPDPGIKETPFVEQVPLDTLFRDSGIKQSQYDQNFQELQSTANAIGNIQALPGSADEAELGKIKDAYQQQLSQFTKANLSDSNVKAQLNELANSTTKVLNNSGIPQRDAAYRQMSQEQRDAIVKGKKYMNSGLTQAESYIKSGKFDPNARFQSDPISPDFDKLYETLDKLKPDETKATDALGNTTTTKTLSPDRVLEAVYANPDMAKYFAATAGNEWEAAKGGLDDNTFATQQLQKDYNENLQNATYAHNPAVRQGYLDLATKAQKLLERGGPGIGAAYKTDFVKNHIYQQAAHQSNAWSYTQESEDAKGTLAELEAGYREQEKKLEQVRQAEIEAGTLIDPATGQPFPGKAEIAGETARLKKAYTSTGGSVFINSNLDDLHRYAKATDDPDFVKSTDGATKIINLTSGILENLGVKDPEYGKGWKQINNESFLKNWKKDNGIEVNQNSPTIATVEGAPAIYIKGNRVVVGVTDGKDITYRDVNANNLFAAEYNHAGSKNAPLLMHSKAENISGSYQETAPTKQISIGASKYDAETVDGVNYVIVKTKADYDALPKGTHYKDDDGSYKLKK